jgi:drug/metabolite transporter (DMT)-like permease
MGHTITNRAKVVGIVCAVLATVIWSGNFIIARGMAESVPPATLAFMRWSVASLAVLPLGLGALLRDWPVVRRNLPVLLLTSLLGVTVFNTVLYLAGRTTVTLNLSLISTTFPVFVIVLSRIFLGEPVSVRRVSGIMLAIGGIVFLVVQGDLNRLRTLTFASGDLWMLTAAFIFAVYSLLVRRKPRDMSQNGFLAFTFLAGLVMLTPWMLWEQAGSSWPVMTMPVVGSVLYIGLMASLVAYFCWNRAVATIGPAKAGFIYYSLPVFSAAEAYLILGEPVTLVHVLSGACVLTGIIVATRS